MNNPEIRYHSNPPASYFVALAAWRRGLAVTFIKNINNYRITSSEKSLFFSYSAMVSGEHGLKPYQVCSDKYRTKSVLQDNDIPTPKGELFSHHDESEEIISYAEKLEYPVVLKDNRGYMGRNVFPNLSDKEEVIEALRHLREHCGPIDVLVEKYIPGKDYKFFVIADKVAAAYTRTPAKIVGDGKRNVEELIDLRNDLRSKNVHLRVSLLEIDEEVRQHLEKEGVTLKTILPVGKVIYLRASESVSKAGDLNDITEVAPRHLKRLAVRALNTIPHMKSGSVDIRYCEEHCPEGSVLEINSMAQIAGHIFPSSGCPQQVHMKLVDYFFPESIHSNQRNQSSYFNMQTIEKYFEAFPESEFTLAPAPVNATIGHTVVIHGKFDMVEISNVLLNEARRLNLSGFIREATTNRLEVILSGEAKDVGLFTQFLESRDYGVECHKLKSYHRPIVSGFYLGVS